MPEPLVSLHPNSAFPDMVKAALTTFVGSRVTGPVLQRGMEAPFINGRLALADAAELLEQFGDNAGCEAATRADISRDAGNVIRFCHWRQIERVIATLSSDEVRGTVH